MANSKAQKSTAKRAKASATPRTRAASARSASKPARKPAAKAARVASAKPAARSPKALAEAIGALEQELMAKKSRLARMRLEMPRVAVQDYALVSSDGEPTRLSALFGDHQDLWFIRNMGRRCAYCTLWADGFNAFAFQLQRRAAFVVCSPDAPAEQAAIKAERLWRFKMVSASQSRIFHELGYQDDADRQFGSPGLIVFRKSADGTITKVCDTMFGPGDFYCPAWDLLELLPDGQNGWEPTMEPPPRA